MDVDVASRWRSRPEIYILWYGATCTYETRVIGGKTSYKPRTAYAIPLKICYRTQRSRESLHSFTVPSNCFTMGSVTMELQPQMAQEEQPNESVPPPTAAVVLERWNQPRSNVYRTLATFWTFLVMGANDAVYGVSASSLNSST